MSKRMRVLMLVLAVLMIVPSILAGCGDSEDPATTTTAADRGQIGALLQSIQQAAGIVHSGHVQVAFALNAFHKGHCTGFLVKEILANAQFFGFSPVADINIGLFHIYDHTFPLRCKAQEGMRSKCLQCSCKKFVRAGLRNRHTAEHLSLSTLPQHTRTVSPCIRKSGFPCLPELLAAVQLYRCLCGLRRQGPGPGYNI